MRKSFTGLIALTKHTLKQDPLSGHLYIYVNRRGNQTPFRIPITVRGDRVPLASVSRETGTIVPAHGASRR
jgi:hypothetical protein